MPQAIGRNSNPTEIQQPKQLIVEGADDRYFFNALLKYLNIADVQIQITDGVDNLRTFLRLLSVSPNFSIVTSIGIVRDADDAPANKFISVCDSLRSVSLSVPSQPIISAGDSPKISILILPNATMPGTLETLCLQTVSNDPVISCIEQYFQCVEQQLQQLPKSKDMDKAKVKVFLASRQEPNLLLGQAAAKGYWNWNDPALNHVKQFLQEL